VVLDYRFARRPKWIAGHVLAVVGIAVFTLAGLWQLDRLGERREQNDLIIARSQGAPTQLPIPTTVAADPTAFEWLLVEFDAEWRTGDEVLLRGRSLQGAPGNDLLTPAVFGGTTIIVNRGWVPLDLGGPPVGAADPTTSAVTIRGVLRTTQERGSFGPVDPPTGRLDEVARVDVGRLAEQIEGPVYPMWVQLLDQQPPQADLPRSRPLPELGEGPHLSYAVQWFIFAGIVVVGYPILLRSTARPARRPRREGADVTATPSTPSSAASGRADPPAS
jgi:surfeit locus 1 family protein